MRQLFEEYNNTVSTASVEDFCRTVLAWLEQHCSLPALRPGNYQSSYLLHEYVKTLCNLKNYMSYACVNFRSEFEKVWQTICLTSYSSPVVCLITSLCGAQHGARRERRVRWVGKKQESFPTLCRATRCMKTTGDESDLTCEIQNSVDKCNFTQAASQLHKRDLLDQNRYYVNFSVQRLVEKWAKTPLSDDVFLFSGFIIVT